MHIFLYHHRCCLRGQLLSKTMLLSLGGSSSRILIGMFSFDCKASNSSLALTSSSSSTSPPISSPSKSLEISKSSFVDSSYAYSCLHSFTFKASFTSLNSSVIKQKGESKNGCFKKTKHAKFPKYEHFLPPDKRTCEYHGVRNVRFSENLVCFFFLKHQFLDSPFCLITDELKNIFHKSFFAWRHAILSFALPLLIQLLFHLPYLLLLLFWPIRRPHSAESN